MRYCSNCGEAKDNNSLYCERCGQKLIEDFSEMKKCPYCAELIKTEAILCRFCKSTLVQPMNVQPVPTEVPERFQSNIPYLYGGKYTGVIIAFIAIISIFFPAITRNGMTAGFLNLMIPNPDIEILLNTSNGAFMDANGWWMIICFVIFVIAALPLLTCFFCSLYDAGKSDLMHYSKSLLRNIEVLCIMLALNLYLIAIVIAFNLFYSQSISFQLDFPFSPVIFAAYCFCTMLLLISKRKEVNKLIACQIIDEAVCASQTIYSIDLSNRGISDISRLADYPYLKEVNLSNNTKIRDLSPLFSLKELSVLNLTGIEEYDIIQICSITSLETIIIDPSYRTEIIREHLPNCRIIINNN